MEVRRTFIVIDSRDRNKMTHPNANNYVFTLDDVIKNVSSVELVYAVYMKFDTETYVNLHIDEFAPNAIANNKILRDSFAHCRRGRPVGWWSPDCSSDTYRSKT